MLSGTCGWWVLSARKLKQANTVGQVFKKADVNLKTNGWGEDFAPIYLALLDSAQESAIALLHNGADTTVVSPKGLNIALAAINTTVSISSLSFIRPRGTSGTGKKPAIRTSMK